MSDLELAKPLKLGDKKGQVKLIQEWLSLQNCYVAIDNDFGPATESSVRAFQTKSGLKVTGIVNDETFELLVKPMKVALQAIEANNKSLADMLVAYAKQHINQHPREIGGQNKGPWVRLYMDGNEGQQWAWCAGFVCFCLKQACKALGKPLPITPSFSVDSLAASAKVKNCFVGKNGINSMGIFLVRNTSTDWTHTGIVTSKNDLTFTTIEGNTNDDGSREGYEVCARTRSYKSMDFIKV